MDKRTSKKSIDFKLLAKRLLLLVLAVYICISTVVNQFKYSRYKAEEKEIDSQLAIAEKKQKELNDEKALLGTDEYYERAARERLGYTKKNEKVFIDINK